MIEFEENGSDGTGDSTSADEGAGAGAERGAPQASPASAVRRGTVRALAPISVVAIVATGAALAPQFASAAPSLPPISAQNLLAKAAQSHVDTYSGTVALTANLGLPALPDLAGGANPLSLFSGTHTMQVAVDGPQKQRLALLDTMSEYDFVHNGSQVWLYDSQQNSVEHATLAGNGGDAKSRAELQKARAKPGGTRHMLTPQQAAQRLLSAIDPSTNVSVDGTKSVAGRAAYTLVLTPRQHGSLIGEITVAIDAQNGAALQLAVYPAGSATPAFEFGFTSVSFSAPSDKQFDFTPPKGATVKPLTGPDQRPSKDGAAGMPDGSELKPRVLGSDWLSVVEVHGVNLGDLTKAVGGSGSRSHKGGNATGLFNGDASSYLSALIGAGKPVHGAFGSGTLYTTDFLSVLVTDDGRLFAGAVTPAVLEADAAAQGMK